MTDTLLGAFLAASRLRPDQQDEIGARVAAEVAQLEREANAELGAWPFVERRSLIHTSDERQPRNDPERRLRTG
jgi:hypothetical protein